MGDKRKNDLVSVPSLGSPPRQPELIVIECQQARRVKRKAVLDYSASCQTITEAAWADLVACGVDEKFEPAHQPHDPHSCQHSDHGYLGKVNMDVRGDLNGYDSEQTFCVVRTHQWPIVITQSFNDADPDPHPSILPFAIRRGNKDQEQKKEDEYDQGAEEARKQWEKDKEELRKRDKKAAESAKRPQS
nr:hypothetical protein LTR18_002823 [Exophiala xenobiotica]